MAWGYRLELMGGREAVRCRENERGCAVGNCRHIPQYLSAYRYTRTNGRAVTATRPLCVTHARQFSMKYSLAWPDTLRRIKRIPLASWVQLAA